MKFILLYVLLIALVLMHGSAHMHRYTVIPQKESYCPDQKCVLFEHILRNSSYFFASGSTIKLLPGDYKVESIKYVVVRNVTNVTWIGNTNSFSPSFNLTVSVNCGRKASFIFSNSTNLHIAGIRFIQCGLAIPEEIAYEAVTIQSHSFYRIPNGTNAAFMFVNVYSLIIERVNITESPGYGLLAVNLLGNSNIIHSFFHLNGIQAQIPYNSTKFYAVRDNCIYTSACKGGNALIIFQDTNIFECSKNDTFSVNSSVFSSGVATESKIECTQSHCIIPGSSGLGIISGQTSYTIKILIINDTFIGNHAYSGANMLIVVHIRKNYRMYIAKSNFSNANLDWLADMNNPSSLVNDRGGVTYTNRHKIPSLFIPLCNRTNDDELYFFLKVQHCTFSNNNGFEGAALFLKLNYIDKIHIDKCIFRENYGESVLHFEVCGYNAEPQFAKPGVILMTNLQIINNNSSGVVNHATDVFVSAVSVILRRQSHKILQDIYINNTTFADNRGSGEATALNVFQTTGRTTPIITVKNSSFYRNVQTHQYITIPKQSGTVFLYGIQEVRFVECIFAHNQGSALAIVGSIIYFSGDIDFVANQGEYGGALALYDRISSGNYFSAIPTRLFFNSHTHLYLVNNKATQRGGAIFVEDPPIHIFKEYDLYSSYWCFYQVVQWNYSQIFKDRDIYIRLENNTALIAGNSLYGGLNDMCSFSSSKASYPVNFDSENNDDAFDSLFTISMPWSQSELASNPHTLCICHNGTLKSERDCVGNPILQSVYPGQAFKIFAVVIGNPSNFYSLYGAVPAAIRVEVDSRYDARLGVRQNTQQLGNSCGELTLTVSTSESYVEVFLSIELPVETEYLNLLTARSVLPVQVSLMSCPFGLQLNATSLRCDCNDQLRDLNCTCFIDEQTIYCPVGTWVGNYSNNVIVHSHCPFDYCIVKSVSTNLDKLDNQCTFNRSGILCGGCQLQLSLALGTSQCIKCSHIFLLLIIPFILAGLLLVVTVQLCNLTVSMGTLHGLIYFINIVKINHAIFFPIGKSNVLSVLIAWMNLDLGIQTCFVDGMDMYTKTWLQFVFPVYIWILVGTIIKVSYHSVLISKFTGSNAVPVLATLFLLSYAKLLRTIITVLSFTHLTYPDGTVSAVWLYDGNVPFLKGKHAALFVMALIFTLGFILPYTLLLLLSPCLQKRSTHRGLHWVNKLKPFLDAYHGPYKDRFRNWTGIMLVVRTVQFIIFAFNVQGDPSINLLVIIICTCVHIVSCWNIGPVYKRWFLNILESYFHLSLGILAGASLYARTSDAIIEKQEAITKSIVGATFAVFILIIVFHILKLSKPYLVHWSAFGKLLNWRNKREHPEQVDHEDIPDNNDHCAPTVSYFELREPLDLLENNA